MSRCTGTDGSSARFSVSLVEQGWDEPIDAILVYEGLAEFKDDDLKRLEAAFEDVTDEEEEEEGKESKNEEKEGKKNFQ